MSQINISFSGVVLLLAGGSGVDPCAAIPTLPRCLVWMVSKPDVNWQASF